MTDENPDDIDTEPVLSRVGSIVEFESIGIGPGERGEIVLSPEILMRTPTLFASIRGADCYVEEIVHGHNSVCAGQWPIEAFRFGKPLPIDVAKGETIKVIVANHGSEPAVVGASLVASRT